MLKAIIAKLEDVEESHRGFYKADGDKFVLQVEGMKTQADIDRVMTSLTKERGDHEKTKTALTTAQTTLQTFEGLDPNDIPAKLAELEQLKATVGTTPDQKKIDEMVASRVNAELKTKVGPLERTIQTLKSQNGELTKNVETLNGTITSGKIGDQLRSEALKAGMAGPAIDDFVSLAAKGFKLDDTGKAITEDGFDVATYIGDQKKARPHFWPTGNGAGGSGSDGKGGHTGPNPFSKKTFNLTEQGKLTTSNPELAAQLKTAAANEKAA